MTDSGGDDSELIRELLKEMKRSSRYYAFSPVLSVEKDAYNRHIRLLHAIYEVLDDYRISKCSHGYTYIKDAVLIIIDLRTLDVCLIKEVYPLIAFKYRIPDISCVEHDIRNSISAAFKASESRSPHASGLLKYYSSRPSNKTLILDTVQKVGEKLFKEFE